MDHLAGGGELPAGVTYAEYARPVAGVLFAAVSGIFRAVMQNEKKKIE